MRSLNVPRWTGSSRGFYEVWFLKLNHRKSGRALWVRYALLSPRESGVGPRGEVWAMSFDPKDAAGHRALKVNVPMGDVRVGGEGLVAIGSSILGDGAARGEARGDGVSIVWDLTYTSTGGEYTHIPRIVELLGIVDTAATSPHVDARFHGRFTVDGETVECDGEPGMQGHLWGRKYGEEWSWCHVNAFEGEGDLVVEAVSGPVRLPLLGRRVLTTGFVRYGGVEHHFNAIGDAFASEASYDLGRYRFTVGDQRRRFVAELTARPEAIIGVAYTDTDETQVHCANSKIADCTVSVEERDGPGWIFLPVRRFEARGTAALETVRRRPFPEVPVKAS